MSLHRPHFFRPKKWISFISVLRANWDFQVNQEIPRLPKRPRSDERADAPGRDHPGVDRTPGGPNEREPRPIFPTRLKDLDIAAAPFPKTKVKPHDDLRRIPPSLQEIFNELMFGQVSRGSRLKEMLSTLIRPEPAKKVLLFPGEWSRVGAGEEEKRIRRGGRSKATATTSPPKRSGAPSGRSPTTSDARDGLRQRSPKSKQRVSTGSPGQSGSFSMGINDRSKRSLFNSERSTQG
jgi:hypothetical protein